MKNFLKILLGLLLAVTVALVGYAIYIAATLGGEPETMAAAVSLNLYWAYTLLALVVLSAIFGAVYAMLKSSGNSLKTIISLVVIVAVVAGSYFIAAGHTVQIPNIENGGVFEAVPTLISETSIYIAYVAMAVTILSAIVTELINAFK